MPNKAQFVELLAERLDGDKKKARAALDAVIDTVYQAVSRGVSGTSMPAFKELSDADHWAVAFYAGTLSNDDAMRRRGAIERNVVLLRRVP